MQPSCQPAKRRSTKHGSKLSTLACGLLLLPAIIVTLVGADAEACTISRDSGYLEGVSIERVLVPDTTSPRLTCQRPRNSCDDQRTHDKIVAAYRVNLITKRVRGDAARGYYAYGESLVLRDQAGNKIDVINRELFNRVNNFESTRLGAQVCVPLATPPAADAGAEPLDAGKDDAAAEEYCVPLPFTELTLTAAELQGHEQEKAQYCDALSSDAGTNDSAAPTSSDAAASDAAAVNAPVNAGGGGCKIVASEDGAAWLALPLVGIILGLRLRRKANRRLEDS
jgi:hypothetical protein